MDNDPNQPESSSYGEHPPPLSQRPPSPYGLSQQPPLYESQPQWGQQPLPQYGGSPIPTSWPPQPPKKRSLLWLWITLALVGGLIALGCIGSAIVVALTLSSFARLPRPVTPLPGNFFPNVPREITAGPDGALWFTERFGDKIGRITTQGTSPSLPSRPTTVLRLQPGRTGPSGS